MAGRGIRAWFRAALGDPGATLGQAGTAGLTRSGAHPAPPGPANAPSAPLPQAEPTAAIHRADYMPPDREATRFTLASDRLPTGHLAHRSGQLVILADGDPQEMVNPRSTALYRLGLYVFRVRGVSYREEDARAGDFSPGARVRLVREPENTFDSNAVAVYGEGAHAPAGYANRQNAARLAKRLDAGEQLDAISMRGGPAGSDSDAPVVLVATPLVLAHLSRHL